MDVGVRALPILSLITFFIGLILALQSAYELRRFGAIDLVATAVAVSMTRELGSADHGDRGDWAIGIGVCGGDRHDESDRRN